MRMPWPFRLFQRAAVPKGTASGAGPGTGGTVAGTGAAPGRRSEWRNLPPLAETVGPPPLIAPSAPFAADLGAGHPPPPVLAPLGHGRGLDAPSGIVVGVAKPVQRAAQTGARPLVQRRPNARAATVTELAQLESTVASEPTSVPTAIADQPTASEGPVRPLPVPVPVPIQKSPLKLARLSDRDRGALDPAQAVGVIGQPKTGSLSGTASASHLALESPAAPAGTSSGPSAPATRAASAPEAKRGSGAPLAGLISRKPADAGSTRTSMPPAVPTRLTLGQSRKVGLGAPLTDAPATAAPISPPEVDSSLAMPLRAQIQRKPEIEASRETLPAIAATPPVLARPREGRSGEPNPAAARPSMPTTPLLSARPLRTSVQRAPVTATRSRPSRDRADSDDRSASVSSAPLSGAPVKVHRGTIASELAESLDAKAFTHQGEIYLPLSTGPLGSPAARALIAHEMTHVAQQRAYGSRLPQEDTAHGRQLEQRAAAAEKHPEMPLAQPPARASQASEQKSDDTATAQRKPADARPPSPIVETTTINFPTDLQRAPEEKVADRAMANRSTKAGNGKKSETELEELAGQLYSRISRRLRRELLVDRERAGLMVDLR